MPKNSSSKIRGSRRAEPLATHHPIIVQSHLRWDFVWQRPQQLLSRFAKNSPVLFIEEPIYLDDVQSPRLDLSVPQKNIFRAVPHLPGDFASTPDASLEVVRDLATEAISSGGALDGKFKNAIQWFYTGMPAAAMLGAFNEVGVVYDCMDELSKFRGAPKEVTRRERLLLANADVVFAGGYALFEAKSKLHDNVHFFGCGVDADHFGAARSDDTVIPEDALFETPVAGYFGVIDERLDYDLLASIARALPDFNIVMVGPTAKVSPDELPQLRNIHWLGQRSYDDLPRYVKAFDVCLMPFSLNEATQYINPTKTLEYMAAGKPIVSTAIADVVRNFTPIVSIPRSHEEFIDAVQSAVKSRDLTLIADGIEMARRSSWESIVRSMQKLIHEAVDDAGLVTTAESTLVKRDAGVSTISTNRAAALPGA